MTLRTEHIEQGWHETEVGGDKWVAEKFYAAPGASATVLRIEAESSKALNAAVALRQSQVGETAYGPVADVTLPGGQVVTTAEATAFALAGKLPVIQEVPTATDLEDNLKAAEGRLFETPETV